MAIEKWDFDLVHSSINFWVRHMMVSRVRGRFNRWTGTLEMDAASPASSRVEIQIHVASIDTREAQRDAHLCSPDFFDAPKHPHILFRSTSVEPGGDRRFRLMGDLSIRGTTRPIMLDVEYAGRMKDPWGGQRAGFWARTSVDRKDFGLTWNQALEAGGILVGDTVEIDIEIEAVARKAAEGGT